MKLHTSTPAFSIQMLLSNVKIGHVTKFCRNPRSKGQKQVKNGIENHQNFDLILTLEIWMPTEFGHLDNFDFSNVYMNGKCLT